MNIKFPKPIKNVIKYPENIKKYKIETITRKCPMSHY